MAKGKNTKFGLALLAGAAAGYVASLFISDKTKNKHKGQLIEAVDDLASKLMNEKDKKRAAELFQNAAVKGEKHLRKTRKILAKNLLAANQTIQEINKDKYLKAVTQTIADLKEKGDLNQKQLQKIQGYLEKDYALFKAHRKETSSNE